MKSLVRSALLTLLFSASAAFAQDNFFTKWQARASATQAKQPAWIVPVIAPYPMLIQVFRAEVVRQIAPARTTTWNFNNTRGLNLIPFARTEVDFLVPPYIEHNTKAKDGFGDAAGLLKYRILSANEKQGNYLLTAMLTATIPTGSYSNGNKDATVNPQLSGGKGFGRFDAFSTLGAAVPVHNGAIAGRPIAWNTVAQYHIDKWVWPEIEDNATFFKGGPNDGRIQNFLAPGLMAGKFKLQPDDPKSRLGLAAGVAMQVATSTFHTYNHGLFITGRFLF